MRKLKGKGEDGMPSRKQLHEILFRDGGKEFEPFHKIPYSEINRSVVEEVAEKLLARFGISADAEVRLPVSHIYYDNWGPDIHVKATLANVVAWWGGAADIGEEEVLLDDEGVLSDWPW